MYGVSMFAQPAPGQAVATGPKAIAIIQPKGWQGSTVTRRKRDARHDRSLYGRCSAFIDFM